MTTINSVSGGTTSAYVAANYPADHNLFALVRVEDQKLRFPDEKIRRMVEDRIQASFIGTVEDDIIIYTMLDLEQYLGRAIHWVTGDTYEQLIKKKMSGHLPNKDRRACTQHLKIIPLATWAYVNVELPATVRIGYRSSPREIERANSMNESLVNGATITGIFTAHKKSKTGWRKVHKEIAWQFPEFPLIRDGVTKTHISEYWKGKSVRFAPYNNCVGCFNRMPLFLAKMFDHHPKKMQWFADQEKKGTWINGLRYESLKKYSIQRELSFDDFSPCDTGGCEP